MSMETPGAWVKVRDHAIVAGQLGREARGVTGVACRCPFGYPAVIETAPVLAGGTPNPTLFYLTCPTMVAAVSRLEATGGVRRLRSAVQEDPWLGDVLRKVTALYRRRRTELAERLPGACAGQMRADAGIGGPGSPELASCLHAYAAALLAVMSGWLKESAEEGAPRPVSDRARRPRGQAEEARSTTGLCDEAREAWARLFPPLENCWCADRRCSRWDTGGRRAAGGPGTPGERRAAEGPGMPREQRASGERRAAIDVGTVSVRLLVADVRNGQVWPVIRRAEVTRLGQGLGADKALDQEARRRTAEVVGRLVDEARTNGAERLVLVGTSAAREAVDGFEFIRSLGIENHIEAAVLSGQREAELAFAGASIDIPARDLLLLDLGGGSTELSFRDDTGAVRTLSLQLGAGRASERWLRSDPATPGEVAAVVEEAKRVFASAGDELAATLAHSVLTEAAAEVGPVAARFGSRRLVGVGGTIITVACLDAGLDEYRAGAVHLYELSVDGVRRVAERLSRLTTAERAALPCMQPGRAQVILGGALIALAALETLGYDKITVSERDLLDGLVLHGA